MTQETVQTTAASVQGAVNDLVSKLNCRPENYNAVVFYASVKWDFNELSSELKKTFPQAEVVGTSTAGEISKNGFSDGTIVLSALTCNQTQFKGVLIGDIEGFPLINQKVLENAATECGMHLRGRSNGNFALVFINALYNAEESVLAMINEVIGYNNILIAGGSSGDDCQMKQTYVSVNGKTASNGVAILLGRTSLKVDVRRENILSPSGKKVSVTSADPETRCIHSLDNQKPITRYANILGVTEGQLPNVMVEHPFGRSFGGETFISAPASFNPDGSLNMYSRILENTQVDILNYDDAIQCAEETCREIKSNISNVQACFHINCLNRTNYFKSQGITSQIANVWARNFPTFAGFTSYGEQINRINSNQTLVVLSIGN